MPGLGREPGAATPPSHPSPCACRAPRTRAPVRAASRTWTGCRWRAESRSQVRRRFGRARTFGCAGAPHGRGLLGTPGCLLSTQEPPSVRSTSLAASTNGGAGRFVPDLIRVGEAGGLLGGGDELHHPGGEPERPPELHRGLVRPERLDLDPSDPSLLGEASGLLHEGPAGTLAPIPGSDHDAGDLERALVGEPRRDSDLPVGHAHDLAVVLGHQDHAVLRLEGLVETAGHLVVEPRAWREDAPVALHALELLEQPDEIGEILRTRLSYLHWPFA